MNQYWEKRAQKDAPKANGVKKLWGMLPYGIYRVATRSGKKNSLTFPWLFTDLKTIFTDLALGDLPNKLLVNSCSISFFKRKSPLSKKFCSKKKNGLRQKKIFSKKSPPLKKFPDLKKNSLTFPDFFKKIPWLFTDFDKNWDFHWLFCKIPWLFPDFWNIFVFPWPGGNPDLLVLLGLTR